MFLSAMERIRVVKINKATVVLHTATPLINGVAGDSGETHSLCLDFSNMRRTRSAVGLILRQNSGCWAKYSSA